MPRVTIAKPFAIGRYEVTKAEHAAFIAATYPRETGCYVWIGGEWGFDGKADWHEPGGSVL
jgi:formylglycine-generating enzyme required for sulfatase activity